MHEGAVPWQEGKGGCLVCCASGRTDRVGVLGAVPWQEGGCSSWTHQCCWHMLSPLWCWGTIRIRGTEVSVCPEGPSWKQLTWMETPGWGQPHQRRRHKMGNGRVWNGAGLEMVAVLPMGPSQGIQYLLRPGQQHTWTLLVPPLALGRMKRYLWPKASLESRGWPGTELHGQAGRHVERWELHEWLWHGSGRGTELGVGETPCVWKGGIPKPPARCPSAQQPLAISRSVV